MNINKYRGLSIVELMVAIALGIFIIATFLRVYLTQTQMYKTSVGQATTQTAENAISETIIPVIRGAGFAGCISIAQALSNLTIGNSLPLGNLNTTPAFVMGYDANTTITQLNAANDTSASDWTPSLDSALAGNVEAGSDVVVLLSAVPYTSPVGVTTIDPTASSLVIQSATNVTAGQYAAVSDCLKTSVFKITGVSGTTITHATGGSLSNINSVLAISFPVGAQFIPLQQIAYFIGQGTGGQSALKSAVFDGANWTTQPLIPGIDAMHVSYGVGSNGTISQYVTAGAVSNWANVYAIRLSFLIAAQAGSGSVSSTNPNTFTMLGKTVTIPKDNRLRHTYEVTIYLRNAIV